MSVIAKIIIVKIFKMVLLEKAYDFTKYGLARNIY